MSGRRWLRAKSDESWALVLIDGATPAQANPTPYFSYELKGALVRFDASLAFSTNGALTAYSWDFGDGTSGAGVAVEHTFATAGSRQVTLSVTDELGRSATMAKTITTTGTTVTNKAPTASLAATTSDLTVSLDASASTDPDGYLTAYRWTFGDGSASVTTAEPTTSHTYAGAGNYTVSVTVVDNGGLTAAVGRTVSVTAPVVTPPVVTPPVVTPPASSTVGDQGVNQTGVDGQVQTGSGVVLLSSLAGSDFPTKVNAGTGQKVSLAGQVYTMTDFAYGSGIGWHGGNIGSGVKGLLGAGSKHTTVEIAPSSSSHASVATSSGTNQLYLLYWSAVPRGFVLDGILFLGTTQGHIYNGLMLAGASDLTISNCSFNAFPGSAGGPPGETFALNIWHQSGGTVDITNVTSDGQKVAAAGIGTNTTSGTINMTDVETSNMLKSAGIATWENSGTINVRNSKMSGNYRNFGAECNGGTINIYDPVWGDPNASGGHDFNNTWTQEYGGGTINVYFSSPDAWQKFIAGRTNKKILVVQNQHDNYSGSLSYYSGSADIQTNFKVWIGDGAGNYSLGSPSTYVSFTGVHSNA